MSYKYSLCLDVEAKGKMRASDAKAHGSDPYGYVTNRVITYMDYPDRVMRPKI